MTERLKIIFASCLSIFVLISIGIYSIVSTNSYKNAADWVTHTHIVISSADSLLAEIQDIETAQRGYVVTCDEKYLEPYTDGITKIENTYSNLKHLTSDNPGQQVLLDTIHSAVSLKIAFAKKVIKARKTQGFASAEELMTTGTGEVLMKKLRSLLNTFNNNENILRGKRFETAKTDFSNAVKIIAVSILLAIAIILTTMFFYIKDHNKRVASEKLVIASEARIKKFIDSMPLGVFIVDGNGKPYYANNKAKEILGKGIVLGTDVNNFPEVYETYIANTNERYPADKLSIARVLKGEKYVLINDIEVLRDNMRIPLRLNTTSITDTENKIEFAIAVIEDITSIKAAEKELIEARRLAEQSGLLKEAFLANMSHEIRTPMNAILGFTNLLLKKDFAEPEKEKLQTIKTSGETLLRIINDILDISKIESGMMTFEETPISIKETFGSLKAMLSAKAQEKNLRLTFECEDSIPEVLLGDPTRLTQIILNLLSNAIKFTNRDGKIDVFAKKAGVKDNVLIVDFSVKDTGIGIAEEKQAQIFERFRQAETTTTRKYGGTGLGLSIAKQMVTLLGGELKVKSAVGVGSVFSFTMPFKQTSNTQLYKRKEKQDFNITDLNKKAILVTEDNPINVKFITSLFADYAIIPDLARDGKEAVELVKNKKYDLILMDIEMPEMNGYEATDIIRNELKSNVPIIAMTAHAMAGEREKCLRLGMNDYISKPIDTNALFEKIFEVSNMQAPNERITNLDFLIRSMRGKKNVILETLNIFLEQVPEEIAAINEAVAASDYKSIRRASHRMKSTVSLVGITEMVKALEEMEMLATAAKSIEEITALNNSLVLLSVKASEEIRLEKNNYI